MINPYNREKGVGRMAKTIVGAVLENDPASRNWFNVILNYPGVHAIFFYRINHFLWTKCHMKLIARFLSQVARFFTGIEIHPGAQIGRGLMIDHGMGVVIGETAIIGDDCQLYHGVTLGGTGAQHVKRNPTLEDGVYIGCGAKCLGNITLKRGCRIGANAVVLKDVPENATAVGIPARIIEKK